MHQTKKGNPWYFGMKVHVGADIHTGVAHTVSVTPANASDISQLPNHLREDDRMVIDDAAYVNDTYQRAARQAGVVWGRRPEGPSETAAGRGAKAAQPQDVGHPQPGGAHFPGDEATVRLHQDPLPGHRQERCSPTTIRP
jgi:IS5 family transposase